MENSAVDFIKEKLLASTIFGEMFANAFEKIFEQAKEMHKQEIITAFELWRSGSGEQYYQETFVSKGSDDHISDISKMVEDDVEKLAEEHYPHHEYTTEEWLKRRLAFKNGYRTAKETLYTEEQVEDKFEKFLDNEIEFGLSQKEIIERIKWYYKKYVKQTKQINMRIGTSSLMDRHLVDFSNENSDRIKSASTQLPQQQTYTLEQMRMAFDYGKSLEPFDSFEEFINSLTN